MKTRIWRNVNLAVVGLWLAGCATSSTIETRKQERWAAYAALPVDQQALVDTGQLAVGMSEDAVYLAWGKPAQVLLSGDASGVRTTWLYQGTTTDRYHTWQYYPVMGPGGRTYLARGFQPDIDVRTYVSAELIFKEGTLESFRTLPRPPEHNVTIY